MVAISPLNICQYLYYLRRHAQSLCCTSKKHPCVSSDVSMMQLISDFFVYILIFICLLTYCFVIWFHTSPCLKDFILFAASAAAASGRSVASNSNSVAGTCSTLTTTRRRCYGRGGGGGGGVQVRHGGRLMGCNPSSGIIPLFPSRKIDPATNKCVQHVYFLCLLSLCCPLSPKTHSSAAHTLYFHLSSLFTLLTFLTLFSLFSVLVFLFSSRLFGSYT